MAKTFIGDIEENYTQAIEDIRARRKQEKDRYEKLILQKIEIALQGLRFIASEKNSQYKHMVYEIIRTISFSRSAKDVAGKLSEIMQTENLSSEGVLSIFNASTIPLMHKEQEIEKLKKAQQRMEKETKKLKRTKTRLIWWILLLFIMTVWMLTRGG